MAAASFPLRLNVAELLRRPGIDKHLQLATSITDLGVESDRLPPGPVGVDLHLDVLTDGVVVHGTVTSTWRGLCRRCLTDVDGDLVVDVRELYQTAVTDPEAFPIVQDQLDLAPMVREALLLDAPSAPLCRPDCAGLCPVCGIDRNRGACTCDTTVRDERWSALDALKPESR